MKKILIVDDQKGWRDFHTKVVLELLGDNIALDTAESANDGYNKLIENNNQPYDIIITDLQMEDDYMPKYAGEWFVEQIKNLPAYYKTKVIIISASPNIRHIAENFTVDCIPKPTALNFISAYKELIC